jgi:hypothetical protein
VTLDFEQGQNCYRSFTFKEIEIGNYWINNNSEIWNYLIILLRLKTKRRCSSTNVILIRMYKNFILVKFWRKFEIKFKKEEISN